MANDITVKIGGDTYQLEKKVKGMKKSFKGLGSSITGAFAGLAVVGGAVVMMTKALKNTISFNKGMAEANTIANLSAESYKQLKREVLSLGQEYGQTTESLTKGLYQALSAGVPADNVVDFLAVASKSAIAGVTDLETSVDGITTVINAYGLKASDAGKISDTFFETIKLGKTTFTEMSGAIGQVATMANTAGISFEETASAIASLTKKGLKTDVAVTQLKGTIKNLINPNDALKKVMADVAESLGIVTIKSLPLQEQLTYLAGAVENDSQAMAKLFPDVRGLNGVLSLTGENAKGAKEDLDAISNSAGSAGKAFAIMADDTSTKLAKMQAGWDKLAITFTDKFVPAISKVIDGVNALMKVGASGVLHELFGTADGIYHLQDASDVLKERQKMIKKFRSEGKDKEADALMGKLKPEQQKKVKADIASVKNKKQAQIDEQIARTKAEAEAKKIKEADKLAKKEVERKKTISSTVKDIEHEVEMMKLKKAGLDKEVSIKRALYQAEKQIGRALTENEKKSITDASGTLYDANAKDPKKTAINYNNESAVQSDALKRIGGSIGNTDVNREGLNLDRKRNELLNGLIKLYENNEKGISSLETLI